MLSFLLLFGRVKAKRAVRLILEERLRVFAPGTLHADDLLLDEDLGPAVLDVGDCDLGAGGGVHVVVVFEVGLETRQAVVAPEADHGLDHYLATEPASHHVEVDALGIQHVLDVQAH